jgi:hypothetical protein
MLAIRVSDNGRGLRPDHLERLFEPFDRLGAEQSPIEGTGIWLALSEGLARVMSGRIEVESVLGGSVFSLVLPRSDPVPHDAPQAEVVPRQVAARSSSSRPTPPRGSTTGCAGWARTGSSPSRSTTTTCSPGSTGPPPPRRLRRQVGVSP